MTTGPNTKSAEGNREKLVNALRDEAQIKQLEAAIRSQEILGKALDVLHKRIARGKVSDNMLLRIVDTLSKSTVGTVGRRPRRRSRLRFNRSVVRVRRAH